MILNLNFYRILAASPDEAARSLAKLSEPERNRILTGLEEEDRKKAADAIRRRLPAALGEIEAESKAPALPPKE